MTRPASTAPAIGIVGAGVMGSGIAQLCAGVGSRVLMHDARPTASANAISAVLSRARDRLRRRKIAADELAMLERNLIMAEGLEELAQCEIVFEATSEDIEVKHQVLRALESVVGPDCVLATNTSSLSVTRIAGACRVPSRVAGAHFFNPVPLMKIVEMVAGLRTEPATLARLRSYLVRTGHEIVEVPDMPGFLVNNAGRAMMTEASRIVGEAIATPMEVDAILREAAGFRMGPFELLDLTGLDVSLPVLREIYSGYSHDPRYRSEPFLVRRLEAGMLGRKVNEGFYRYSALGREDPPRPALARWRPMPVRIDPAEAAAFPWVARLLLASGVEVMVGSSGAGPGADLVLPLGEDATTTAARRGLDPARVIAIDPLLPTPPRLTLMRSVATREELVNNLVGMLAERGVAASVISDSPGFVVQRVLCMIVNMAAEIAQQRIATPAQIDRSIELALAYPQGPFRLARTLGPAVVLQILERLHAFYQDPRYRPSPWLRRRVTGGLPLDYEEGSTNSPAG